MAGVATRRLEIDALRTLWAVREQGGVTRAATALGMSQSAVSHKIRRLEASLGCDLLARRPNGPNFTPAGDELLGYAQRILGLHDEAVLSLTRTSITGRIALGLTEDTTCSELARILGRFHHLHPNVTVRTRVRMSLALQDLLLAGELDAAILLVFAHDVRPSDLVLFRESLRWVKSPDWALPASGPLPFLSFSEDCFYRRWAYDVAQDDGLVLETVFECSSAVGIVTGVAAGLGIALLNNRHVTQDIEVIEEGLPDPPGIAYVVRRARNTRNPVLDALVAEIKADIGRFGGLRIAG
jgi:DNA-binding transcriptional LysR family regulator